MKKQTGIFTAILALILMPVFAFADDLDPEKLAKALEKYEKTDAVRNCIHIRNISTSTVIDDQHILFKMSNRKAYLNILPSPCPRLGFEKAFSYKTRQNQLCNLDIINVLVSGMSMPGPACGLGKFEEYEKIGDNEEQK